MQLNTIKKVKWLVLIGGICALILGELFRQIHLEVPESYSKRYISLIISGIFYLIGVYFVLRALLTRSSAFLRKQQVFIEATIKNKRSNRTSFDGKIPGLKLAAGIEYLYFVLFPLLLFTLNFSRIGVVLITMWLFIVLVTGLVDPTLTYWVRDNVLYRRSWLRPWRNSIWPLNSFVLYSVTRNRSFFQKDSIHILTEDDRTLRIRGLYDNNQLIQWCRDNLQEGWV